MKTVRASIALLLLAATLVVAGCSFDRANTDSLLRDETETTAKDSDPMMLLPDVVSDEVARIIEESPHLNGLRASSATTIPCFVTSDRNRLGDPTTWYEVGLIGSEEQTAAVRVELKDGRTTDITDLCEKCHTSSTEGAPVTW